MGHRRQQPLRYPYYDYGDYREGGTGKRRFYFVLALVWLFAGVGLLGFAGYHLFIDGDGVRDWIYARPSEDSPVAVAEAQGVPAPPLGDQPYRLVIEKIGVDAPIASYGMDENAHPLVPYQGDIVAWYTFSTPPGSGDNAVFAGHYTWNGDAIFRHLDQMAVGDRVVIRGESFGELIYRVSDVALVEPTAEAAQHWMTSVGYDVITLITCGGERHETNDFFGAEYDKRQIVRAELVTANVY